MALPVPRQGFALDPLIAEAKRRARQRRLLIAVSAFALLGVAAALALELPSSGGGTGNGIAGTRDVSPLTIPKGTDGIAVIVYGRLSVTTKTGFHIHGLPVDAAALSPRARYVAAGIGPSLTELAPSGRRLWSQPVGETAATCGTCNTVASIAWSPDGSRIAYLVRSSRPFKQVLHVIRRDGTHDAVIDRNAHGGQPSWRADSRAFAYIGAHGKPVIYDIARRSSRVITWPIARSIAPKLAFAPRGGELAIGTDTAVLLVGGGRDEVVWRGNVQEVNWVGGRLAVSESIPPTGRFKTQLFTVTRAGARLSRTVHLPGPILAAHGRTIAFPLGAGVVAGPIGALQRVFRFKVKPPIHNGLCLCGEIAIGMHDISLG